MILDNPIFVEAILPFLLVFVVVFAILQKSKLLGEGKEQIDALVALVIGLILIGVPGPREIVVGLMPWLAVGIAVILVFLILYGFVVGDLSGNKTPKWLKNGAAALAGVFTVGILLYVSGLWEVLFDWLSISSNNDVWMSIVIIALVIGVMAIVINSSKKDKEKDHSSNEED
tara:strand:- start:15646 stop:16161 length:516 start_codon:yes stop_codon:yes gene_type:complete